MPKLTRLLVLSIVSIMGFALLARAATDKLITGWALVAPAPQPIAYHRAVFAGNRVLMIGGEVPVWTTPIAPLLQAKVESDGSIRQWATPVVASATRLPQPLHRHAVVQASRCMTNVLYLIGGYSNGNRYAQVWRTYWNVSLGQLSGWTEVHNYPRKIILHEAIYTKNRIYVLGGLDEADEPLDEVYSVEVYGNGDLATWRTETKLPKPLYRFATVSYAGDGKQYIYVIGGYDGKEFQQAIYRAEIGDSGGWPEWKKIGLLPRALAYHRAAIISNQLIVIGGTGNDGSYNEVYSVVLNADNKLGDWQAESNLPDSISRFAAMPVTLPDWPAPVLYVIGGSNGDNFRTQVYHSQPAPPLIPTNTPSVIVVPNLFASYLPIILQCP